MFEDCSASMGGAVSRLLHHDAQVYCCSAVIGTPALQLQGSSLPSDLLDAGWRARVYCWAFKVNTITRAVRLQHYDVKPSEADDILSILTCSKSSS